MYRRPHDLLDHAVEKLKDDLFKGWASFDDGARLGGPIRPSEGEAFAALLECEAGTAPWPKDLDEIAGAMRSLRTAQLQATGSPFMDGAPGDLLAGSLSGEIQSVRVNTDWSYWLAKGRPTGLLKGKVAQRALALWHYDDIAAGARCFGDALATYRRIVEDPRAGAAQASELFEALDHELCRTAMLLTLRSYLLSCGIVDMSGCAHRQDGSVDLGIAMQDPEGLSERDIQGLAAAFTANREMQEWFVEFRPTVEKAANAAVRAGRISPGSIAAVA